MATLLVTGGAGFIGSCYVLTRCAAGDTVLNLDKLTYSGNLDNVKSLHGNAQHIFVHGDIGNAELVEYLLTNYQPDAVVNFAAESHVDRSILNPEAFVRTNVLSVCTMLRTVQSWWQNLSKERKAAFRFLHVSTDEVFGTLQPIDPAFTEETPYSPNSPYSASKASSDHFVRAFHETYGFPTLITNCSNNYGPRQFPEKFIPLVTLNALARKKLPVYGTGANIRDWLHVEDHCTAIHRVLEAGSVGQTYNIGGNSERTNLEVVHGICAVLDELRPSVEGPYAELIQFVSDRLGHDFRYAINCTKLSTELGWHPTHTFETGLRDTVLWYLEHPEWVNNVQSGDYRAWMQMNYAGRA